MNLTPEKENHINLEYLLTEATSFIREVFLKKWKENIKSDLVDEKEIVKYFKDGPGKTIFKRYMNDTEKDKIEQGNTNEWDISFFNLIFRNCLSNETEACAEIKNIKNVRNIIAHNSNMSISDKVYEDNSKIVSESLIKLGYDQKKLENFISNLKNNNNLKPINYNEEANKLKDKANKFFIENDYSKAIDTYTQALSIKNISENERAILYCNRSLAYLKLYESSDIKEQKILYRALNDAELACSHNPRWFKAYARLGYVYKELNDLKKSIEYLTKAYMLDPGNEELKLSLAKIKELKFDQYRSSHFDDMDQPLTTEERKIKYIEKFKIKMGENASYLTEKNLNEFTSFLTSSDKNLEDVFKGHEYRDGSKNFKQNYELAAKLYSKAAQNGNAEAMYNLALLTKKGLGVKQDYKAAIGLLKQAANQPSKRKLFNNFDFPNVGVAEAQHSLGIIYQEGLYVHQSYSIAAEWYQLAVDNECSRAANNLGLLYMYGNGVKKDLSRAESLFLFSHRRGCNDSITNLVLLYIQKMDPEKALLWHQRALENNSFVDINRNEEIMEMINNLKSSNKISEINLKHDDLYQQEKITKFIYEKYPDLKKLINGLQEIEEFKRPDIKSVIFEPKVLMEYAEKGSETAKTMLSAQALFYYALIEFKNNRNSKNFEFKSILHDMARAFLIDYLVCQCPFDLFESLIENIEKVLKMKSNDGVELDARICYMHLKASDLNSTIEFISESILIYPNNFRMYELRGCLYCFLNEQKTALKDFDFILDKDPENYSVIYLKAAALRILDENKEAINFYKSYLNKAPLDDRKVPESYYAIGVCEIQDKAKDYNYDIGLWKNMLEEHLKKGKEAEKLQLPCFLPYESNSRKTLENFLTLSNFENKDQLLEETKIDQDLFVADDYRIQLIKRYRSYFPEMKNISGKKSTTKPTKKQKMPTSLENLKLINLNEIDFTKDEILHGYVMKLRIFDRPLFGFTSVHFIVEDEKKSVELMCVYNLGNNYKEIDEKFKISTEFSLINPYIRMAADGYPMLRVDDPNTIIFSGRTTEKMCRFCGRENSKYNCSRCMKASYCSKRCQVDDWKILNHKLICF